MADPREKGAGGGSLRELGVDSDRSLIGENALEQNLPGLVGGGDGLLSPNVVFGGDKVVAEDSPPVAVSGDISPAGQVANLINLFDRKTGSRKSAPLDLLNDAGMVDRAESQPLRLEPWSLDNNEMEDNVDQVRESTMKSESMKFPDGSISLQLNPDTLLHILQSFTQTNNTSSPIYKKLPTLSPESRKTPPNTTSFNIYRSAPYKTRSLTRNLNRDSPNPYLDSSISQPFSLNFPITTLEKPSTALDTMMNKSTPSTQSTETSPLIVGQIDLNASTSSTRHWTVVPTEIQPLKVGQG